MRRSLVAYRTLWSFLAVVTCGISRPLLAGQPNPAGLFGVDLGTHWSLLEKVARASLSCREVGTPTNALICEGALVKWGRPEPESTTFWVTDRRVSGIFQVSRLTGYDYSQSAAAFRQRLSEMTTTMGRPPTVPAVEPAKEIDDEQKLVLLAQGRLGLKAVWRILRRDLSLTLHGDKGTPVLVVGLEPAPQPSCDAQSVATMLMDLFPPANATARTQAAQGLAACNVTGAAGALAAAAEADPEKAVQVEAVRSLAELGPAGLPGLQNIARKGGEAAAKARETLAEHAAATEKPPNLAGSAAPWPGSGLTTAAVPPLAHLAPAETTFPPQAAAPPPPGLGMLPPLSESHAAASAARPTAQARLAEGTQESKPADPQQPVAPSPPRDGTFLTLATSLVAGGVWGGGLSLLAQQSSPGVVLLVGSAGAVIGGGTAWGITHFGLRPSPTQALWFANSTAWGTLAGLLAWSGSGSENVKLKWGLLVGGESIGMGMGVLGARKWGWTTSQILLANTLVLGAGAAGAGARMLAEPGQPMRVSPLVGYGAAPAMAASAILSRYIHLSKEDVNLAAAVSIAGAWSGGLLAYGLDMSSSTRNERLMGGALVGVGAGYLGAVALSPFVDVAPGRTWSATAGVFAGNLLGLGSYMVAEPDETKRRPLWASLGGLGLGVGSFVAYPYLRLGTQGPLMAGIGATYGAATWGLAMVASSDGSSARLQGGVLALGTAGSIAGLLASGSFSPNAQDYVTTTAGTALGAAAGIGVAKLATATNGTGEMVGTLAGSAAGFVAAAAVSHYTQLHLPDLGAAALGAGYGALAGALAPSLANSEWGGWPRNNQGGLLVGISAGAFAATGLSHWLSARGENVAMTATGSALGLGIGTGIGLLWPDSYSQPARIGALAGSTTGLASALLLKRWLYSDEGLGSSAPLVGAAGVVLGAAQGLLLAGVVDPSGEVAQARPHALAGGILLGSSAGLASGLLVSTYYRPSAANLATVALADGAGAVFGRGLAMTIFGGTGGRRDGVATLAGSLAGLTAGALTEHLSPLSSLDLWAAGEGMGYGAIVGSLAPTLADSNWGGWQRRSEGGLLLGLGGGALVGATLAHVTSASPATVVVSSSGALLGLGIGTGAGLLWPSDYSKPARVAAVSGISVGLAASILLEKPLRLDQGLGESAAGLGLVGTGIGIAEGVLLAGLVDPNGEVSRLSRRQIVGGALLGGSAGLASGLLLSKYYTPGPGDFGVTVGGAVLGGLFGRGLVMTASPGGGQRDSAATLAGVLAGTAAGAFTQRISPLGEVDLIASAEGAAIGGVAGALAPSLTDKHWTGWERNTQGGLLLGLSGGALAAAGLAHVTQVRGRTLALSMAGAIDGALTGAGIGLLADGDPTSTQGARIGVVAGATSGLAVGLGLWPRIDFDTDNLLFLSAASALGGWTGAWAPVLGHAAIGEVDGNKIRGGLLAGAGGASMLATALMPALHVDRDLLGNALLLHAFLSGAGAGAGALANRRADAPVWGMLGAGTAGLLLGGTLHESIDLEKSRGLLAFAGLEGLWAGAWLPYLLRPSNEVRSSDQVAGLAAGGLGAAGLSLLAGTVGAPSGQRLGMAGVGSAIGASISGGSVLLTEELHDQRGVGIMLGGTAVGLSLGALMSPFAPMNGEHAARMLGGAGLGAAEGLAFAWAGRGTTRSQFAGSTLIGAGVGATLGLATSADADGLNLQQALVASGFSAWGGWIGSFSGAFVNRDPHEVVLGGLAAANVGFLAGYGALKYDLVDPRDFAWISLAGALGTALGGGAGAAMSSQSNPRPVLAGLALGPVVGIAAGAIVVPRFRHKSTVAYLQAPQVAGASYDLPSEGGAGQRNSTDVLAQAKPSKIIAGLELARRHFFDVSNWTPVFGALPPPPGDPNPAPLFMGVSGGLR